MAGGGCHRNEGRKAVNVLPSSGTVGWFKTMRSPEYLELIKRNKNAFVLASVIAWRVRFHDGFNANALERGEAMIGDFENYDMTRGEYRTALAQLVKWNFIAIKTTTRGVIAKLIDTRLFDPLNISDSQQDSHQTTTQQPSNSHRTATNKEGKKETRKQGTGKTGDGSQTRRRLPPVEKRPETFQDVEQFAAKKGFESDVAARFVRYNNSRDWPVDDWRGAFVNFAEMAADSPGGVSSVPEDWNPEILR